MNNPIKIFNEIFDAYFKYINSGLPFNPIKIFNEIFDAYFKYINSGLPFCREEYNQERNALIQEPGTICQPPIIEIVPKYHEKATLKEFCKNEGVSE